jgi:dipeptidase D
VSRSLEFDDLIGDSALFIIYLQGLHGGHSGLDIHKQRANANKILARTLDRILKSCSIRLVALKGGTAHNAIPRDAEAIVACSPSDAASVAKVVSEFEGIVQTEYAAIEPHLAIGLTALESETADRRALREQETRAVIDLVLSLPHGVMGMSPDFERLVETSNNLATVEIANASLQILTSQRSSVMSRMDEVTSNINATAALAGASSQSDSEFAPWTPNMESALLKRCQEVYEKVSGRKPVIQSLHAGLECAIIGEKYDGMDMISFGPTMQDPHSPNERLFVPSIGKVWDFMVALLESYGSK